MNNDYKTLKRNFIAMWTDGTPWMVIDNALERHISAQYITRRQRNQIMKAIDKIER